MRSATSPAAISIRPSRSALPPAAAFRPARSCPTSSRRSIGAIVAAALLYVIASGAPGFDVTKGFASNGYDAHSPGQYSMVVCFITEVVMTMMFLFIIMGSTHGKAPAGFAPLAIGLALVMIHLVSIPVTNTSVNPARSTGPALFVGGWALAQLWLFWVAPLIGGALGGVIYRWLSEEPAGVVEGLKTGLTSQSAPSGTRQAAISCLPGPLR